MCADPQSFITAPPEPRHCVVLRFVNSFKVPQFAIVALAEYRTSRLKPHAQRVRFGDHHFGISFNLFLLFKTEVGECQSRAIRRQLEGFLRVGPSPLQADYSQDSLDFFDAHDLLCLRIHQKNPMKRMTTNAARTRRPSVSALIRLLNLNNDFAKVENAVATRKA